MGQDYIRNIARQAREASLLLRTVTTEQKNKVLLRLAGYIRAEKAFIQSENRKDIEQAEKSGLSPSLLERLRLTDKVVESMAKAAEEIAALPDPVGEVMEGRILPNGLELKKLRIPIGVIAIIYESRPNVTIDVGALGLKSSNAVILRGGKEALFSNLALSSLFSKALQEEGIPQNAVQLIENTDRNLIETLVRQKETIDLIVPRGGEALIQYVTEHSLVPVVKHDKGVVHIFLDESADKDSSIDIVVNSKVQRPSVCNAAETLLFHKDFPYLADVLAALKNKGVVFHTDAYNLEKLKAKAPAFEYEPLTEEGFHREYLSLDISLKIVKGIDEAISHIHEFTSEHSEAILSNHAGNIRKFQQSLHSAAIFVNCSTRFHDGGQFGYGAEVGIATGKLHVRGPMGLRDLTTMKYIVTGEGQVRP